MKRRALQRTGLLATAILLLSAPACDGPPRSYRIVSKGMEPTIGVGELIWVMPIANPNDSRFWGPLPVENVEGSVRLP